MVGVTADTNVYISALNFGGAPDKLLDMVRAGEIELHISGDILAEVMRVLRDKFHWLDEALTWQRTASRTSQRRFSPARRSR